MASSEVALFCSIYPQSIDKQEKILSLLRKGAREYYTTPEANCTTWSYFTPFPANSENLVIGGLEIYTEKSALQKQVDDPVFFKPYHETVKQEGLYAKEEELVAWYFAEGFVARGEHALPFGKGNLISQTRLVGDREAILQALRAFLPFVRDQEPGVLTYAVFTRPKAPKEVLLFARYKDLEAMKSHGGCPEHVAVGEKLVELTENDAAKGTSLWQEIDDSFVSNHIGGPSNSRL